VAGYEFGATNEQRARLAELAAALVDCRSVFLAAFEDGVLEPRDGSQVAHDFALELAGPAGPWPGDINIQPRTLAAKLVRQQVDFCACLGISIGAGEVFDPISSLVRGAVEYATRAVWVIDPSANDPHDTTAGHRTRSARTLLVELVSAEEFINAFKGRDDVADELARIKAARLRLRELARAMFDHVDLSSDSRSNWSVGGQRYSSWSAIAKAWAEMESAPVHGGKLYGLLTVESHPQGFIATRGLRPTDTGPARAVAMDDIERRVQLALVASYSSLMLLANYHGYSSSILKDWETRTQTALPGVFRT
jgi:hypothetical protein